MKPLPAPNIPGKSESERVENALKAVLDLSKRDLQIAWNKIGGAG